MKFSPFFQLFKGSQMFSDKIPTKDQDQLVAIVAAAYRIASAGQRQGQNCGPDSVEFVGPVAAVLVQRAIDTDAFKRILLGQ